MKTMRWMMLSLVLMPGLGFPQSVNAGEETPPIPPHAAFASAWLAQANQDYGRIATSLPQFGVVFLESIPVPPDTWVAVRRLGTGERIRVVNADFERIKGRFVRATEDAITFQLSTGSREAMTIPRREVRMVSIRYSKAERVLVAILAGALIGSVAMAEASNDSWSCAWEEQDHASGKELAVGAAAGAVLFGVAEGLAEPGDEVIYAYDPDAAAGTIVSGGATALKAGNALALGTPATLEGAVPTFPSVLPGNAGAAEGGNVFVPVTTRKDH